MNDINSWLSRRGFTRDDAIDRWKALHDGFGNAHNNPDWLSDYDKVIQIKNFDVMVPWFLNNGKGLDIMRVIDEAEQLMELYYWFPFHPKIQQVYKILDARNVIDEKKEDTDIMDVYN